MASNATRLIDEDGKLPRKEEDSDPDTQVREAQELNLRLRRALDAAKLRKINKQIPASQYDIQQESKKTLKANRDELKSLRNILTEINNDADSTKRKVKLLKYKLYQVQFCIVLIVVISICFAGYIVLQ